MSEYIIQQLVETRQQVVLQVNQGILSVATAASILGMTRQGLWKLRKKIECYGVESITGRKRRPKSYQRVWNSTPDWLEEKVTNSFTQHGVGPDRLLWILEEEGIASLSRSTAYRILVRRRLHTPKVRGKREKPQLYAKGYPGEEVQLDTTQPLGKSGPTLISAIDDYSRYGAADCYQGNASRDAAAFLQRLVDTVPFPITAVRVDNGSEFKKDFIRVCRRLDIHIIRNPVRHPTSNGKVERFHRIIVVPLMRDVNETMILYKCSFSDIIRT